MYDGLVYETCPLPRYNLGLVFRELVSHMIRQDINNVKLKPDY